MKNMVIGQSNIESSNIALGCMRMAGLTVEKAKEVIETALEVGINFFDHADIYGAGASELIFAKALKLVDVKREDIIIQSKVGIRSAQKTFDFSYEYIIESVEGVLERLDTDYLDILLLHRPDTLMEPEEVARAFKELFDAGKVKYFGVSNFNPYQVDLLQQALPFKLVANQIQFSLMHSYITSEGIYVNMNHELSSAHTQGVLEYSRLKNITLQAWSPYQYGFFEGSFIDNDNFPVLNERLQEIADKYNSSKEAIATAWILRHPANIQVIAGTMTPERIRKIASGSSIYLTREEWYSLYASAGVILP